VNPSSLPAHGRVDCVRCHRGKAAIFDQTVTEEENWRIRANPLAWGNPAAEIVVLGFSKGSTHAGALASTPHDDIAYKGGRLSLGKILAHCGLISNGEDSALKKIVDNIISDKTGRFHFGSLIRCTVERKTCNGWTSTGGGMLDRFVASKFGAEVAGRCASTFLGNLPSSTKIVIMLGMGADMKYVCEARKLFERAVRGRWCTVNDVAYTNGGITVVHVEHFKSQGSLIPNWLSGDLHPRGKLGLAARGAIQAALKSSGPF
jgi:hypothetical protein